MQTHISRSVLILMVSSTVAALAGCGSQPKSADTQAGTTAPMTSGKPMVMPAKPMATTMSMGQPMAEPVVLKFTDKSIKAIQAGTKTATIRSGVRVFPMTVRAVGNPGEMVMLDGVTTLPKKMSDLTEADAKANGSASLNELKAELAKDYPAMKADDMVTVVMFKLWKA